LKADTTGSFLLAPHCNFKTIFTDLAKHMSEGEHLKPETEDEKLCFSMLDHVGGHVKGSLTSKNI
jgi:hypothetical protein